MPFALVTIGLIMVITGVRNTYADFGAQVRSDFTGAGNFTYWIASIGAVGALGYVDALRGFANLFMALIIIAMVLKNGGVFDKFKAALASGGTPPAQAPSNAAASPSGTSSSAFGGGGSNQVSSADVAKMAQFAMMFA